MAFTKEDFQAFGEMMAEKLDEKLQPIRADIADLRQRLTGFEEEVRQELSDVRQELSDVRQELSDVRQELGKVNQDIRRLNQSVAVLEKEVRHDFRIIRENSGDWNARNRQIDRIEKTQEDHHDRIWALEQVVKASNL